MDTISNSITGLSFTLFVLICLSAFFSSSETALSSCSKIRLKNIAKTGNKKAVKVLTLIEDFDNALSTILIGNNVVNIAAASIATVVFTAFFGSSGLAVATIVMTIIVLIFGEILPKSFAKDRPEIFAMWCAPYLHFLIVVFTPLNIIFKLMKEQFRNFFNTGEHRGITEDELMIMVDEVENEGAINKQDSELIKSAIEFSDIRVKEILTPRVDIVSVDINEGNAAALKTFTTHGFSRLPVYKENEDQIIGIIHAKDFFSHYINNQNFRLERIVKNIAFVHSSTKISLVLKTLQDAKVEMAIVIDSYGAIRGLVTTEDIVEELVGEIWDEHDKIISTFHEIGKDKYLISCNSNLQNANLHDLFKYLKLDIDQYKLENNSISGWVVETLGEIPHKGDDFTYRNLHVTVNKTNMHRVLEIIVDIDRSQKTE
ncbi:MAG: hemolysin family protein [Acidaminococcaceae bacterium]|nr:hemolysin family protein [Acidaminococcaceae bacterium]